MVADKLTFTVTEVTPTLAKEWLDTMIKNRNPKPAKITQYAEDMRLGKWRINGEAIKFSAGGHLLDGQNRLLACIKADTAFTTTVIGGLADVDQDSLDGGVSRRYADVLKLRGLACSVELAALIRGLHGWEHGQRRFDGGSAGRQASNSQLDVTLDNHPEMAQMAPYLKRVSRISHLPLSVLGALWSAFTRLDAEDAMFFFERLVSDEGHYAGEPIFALRRQLLTRNRTGFYTNPTYAAALTIKAWNAYRVGAPVQLLVYRPGGASREKFPEPR
jgi:hypothetical protein